MGPRWDVENQVLASMGLPSGFVSFFDVIGGVACLLRLIGGAAFRGEGITQFVLDPIDDVAEFSRSGERRG